MTADRNTNLRHIRVGQWLVLCILCAGLTPLASQTFLSDLEWAPDSNYVILTKVNGEPRYLHRDSLAAYFAQENASAQDLSILDSFLNVTGGNAITMTALNQNEVVFTDVNGNTKKYVFLAANPLPITDEQQLSLAGNTLSLTNGGSVNLSGLVSNKVDTLYAVGNELRYAINGTVYSIVIESCQFCDPITAVPANLTAVTENQSLGSVTTVTSLNYTTVVVQNTSECSALTGLLHARGKLEIYGHLQAKYIAYLEYRVDAGAWTKIAESEKEIYRTANFEEDIDLYGMVPVSVASGQTDVFDLRAKIEVLDTGYPTLFVIVADPEAATWKTSEFRINLMLSNDSN